MATDGNAPPPGRPALQPADEIPYGKPMRDLFLLDPDYLNLNHGSYGSMPRAIRDKLRSYQDAIEARPDAFVRYEYEALLNTNRRAAAALLGAPVDTVVLVPNATTAIHIVLNNLTWHPDGRDEILYFATIYGACHRSIDYVVDTHGGAVRSRAIPLAYPIEDDAIVARFHAAVAASAAAGQRPRVCVFDVVSSLPGVRFPFEAMVAACRARGVTSVVDGAQGVGMVPLALAALDPDFFFTNGHKWLYTPRGSAVLYVPRRHQHRIRATMPISHSYTPGGWGLLDDPVSHSYTPAGSGVPDDPENDRFGKMFTWVGTVDSAPLLCFADAIRWRAEVLGGEAAVVRYLVGLARAGGQALAAVLGTEVLDNATHTATACALVNVRLPLEVAGAPLESSAIPPSAPLESSAIPPAPLESSAIPSQDAQAVADWMMKTLVYDYRMCIVVYVDGQQPPRLWLRLSAQVYLDVDDFRRAGAAVLDLCERVRGGAATAPGRGGPRTSKT